jgi:hypothetical protein
MNSRSKHALPFVNLLKPIWAYGTQLWGTASTSNVQVLEGSAHDNGRAMVHDVPNAVIRKDLRMPESSRYSERLGVHPNELISNLAKGLADQIQYLIVVIVNIL